MTPCPGWVATDASHSKRLRERVREDCALAVGERGHAAFTVMPSEEHRTADCIAVREVPTERSQQARAERVLVCAVTAALVIHPRVDAVGQRDDIDEATSSAA